MQKIQLSKIIPRIPKVQSFDEFHVVSKKRIEAHINRHLGTGHVKEYMLMKEFEEKKLLPYIIAVEYEIDDGVKVNHSGDVLCYDGNKELVVVELKCIKSHKNKSERFLKVKDQSNKLTKRLSSWMRHATWIDLSMEKMKEFNVYGAYFTDEQDEIIYL